MVTDDERRELAAMLRETCDEIEHEGNGLTVYELADVLNISEDCSGMMESLNLDDVRNLAGLIDPTCELIDRGDISGEPMVCSCCGKMLNRNIRWHYCPSCGARVVGE